MAWVVKLDENAIKDLSALDKQVAKRIIAFIKERLAVIDNPRSIGEALRGKELGKYWKYRVGDYRLISKIEDAQIVIIVVCVGHRKQVYQYSGNAK